MSVREVGIKHEPMNHFPDDAGYRWLELFDRDGVYGHAAICEREDMLELHVSFARWGPQVRRCVIEDVNWLKDEARRLGVSRITGVRADGDGGFNPGLFRFARLFGFSDHSVLQMATLKLKKH